MKKSTFAALALALTALTPAFQQAKAAPQTLDGVISDSMCGKKHMMPGKSAADCTAECVKEGSKYILVSGNKIYTLAGKPQAIAPFAGKHVSIQGDLKETTLTVNSIHEAKAM